MDWDFLTALIKLLLLLPVVAGLAYLAIRFGLGKINSPLTGKGSAMRVVDRLPVTPKSALLVVKVVDKYYLLAQNENTTSFLRELEKYPENPDKYVSAAGGAGDYLQKFKQKVKKHRFSDREDWDRNEP